MVDLGLQETTWNGATKLKHKIYIAFEVPAVRVEWEKNDVKHEGPALVGQMYTNSIGDKSNLGKHLVSWRGRSFTDEEKTGFDLFNILDAPCQISVVHNQSGDRIYANISGIIGLPPGVQVPDRETDLLAYSPADSEKAGNFENLPDWMKEKCRAGHETATGATASAPPPMSENPASDDFDDSIPF